MHKYTNIVIMQAKDKQFQKILKQKSVDQVQTNVRNILILITHEPG